MPDNNNNSSGLRPKQHFEP